MGIFVVRLKAIKYNKDSSYYLSSYPPNLGLLVACLLTLVFRPYAFRIFVFSVEHICSSKLFLIPDLFYNLSPYLLSSMLTSKVNFFCCNEVDQTPDSCTYYV